jgi:hypothetical protein
MDEWMGRIRKKNIYLAISRERIQAKVFGQAWMRIMCSTSLVHRQLYELNEF